MAAPRRRRLDEILGTTAERLVVAARRPVLVVSSKASRAPYDRVVLASDLSVTSSYAARAASEMNMFANSSTWAVHAFDPGYPGLIDDEESPDLVVSALDERPALSRLFGRNMTHVLLRAGAADVLIVPSSPGLARRSPLQVFTAALREAA